MLKITNGKRIEVTMKPKELVALQKEQEKRKEEVRKKFGDYGEVKEKLTETLKEYKKAKDELSSYKNSVKIMSDAQNKRSYTFERMKAMAERSFKRTFKTIMSMHGLGVQCKFISDTNKLHVKVTPPNAEQPLEVKSLSGGEKSKTLIFMIYSLWDTLSCPFMGLDEWDVFLDEKARTDLEKIIVETACNRDAQFFFISPQNSSFVADEDEKIKVNILRIEK